MGTCCTSDHSIEPISTERPDVKEIKEAGKIVSNTEIKSGEKDALLPPATNNDGIKGRLLLSVAHSIKNDPNQKEPIADYQVIYDDREECKMAIVKGVLSASNLIEYIEEEETTDLPAGRMIITTNAGVPATPKEYISSQQTESIENDQVETETKVEELSTNDQQEKETEPVSKEEDAEKSEQDKQERKDKEEDPEPQKNADSNTDQVLESNDADKSEQDKEKEEAMMDNDEEEIENDDQMEAVTKVKQPKDSDTYTSLTVENVDEDELEKEASYDIEDENEDIVPDKLTLSKSTQDVLDMDSTGNVFGGRWGEWNDDDLDTQETVDA